LELSTEAIGEDVTMVIFNGRLDVKGASAVDMKLSIIAGSRRRVIFNIAEVSFMASMGIRCIVTGAKTIKAKGGRAVIYGPNPDVEKVLTVSGIDTMIPIHHDLDEAVSAVSQ